MQYLIISILIIAFLIILILKIYENLKFYLHKVSDTIIY